MEVTLSYRFREAWIEYLPLSGIVRVSSECMYLILASRDRCEDCDQSAVMITAESLCSEVVALSQNWIRGLCFNPEPRPPSLSKIFSLLSFCLAVLRNTQHHGQFTTLGCSSTEDSFALDAIVLTFTLYSEWEMTVHTLHIALDNDLSNINSA